MRNEESARPGALAGVVKSLPPTLICTLINPLRKKSSHCVRITRPLATASWLLQNFEFTLAQSTSTTSFPDRITTCNCTPPSFLSQEGSTQAYYSALPPLIFFLTVLLQHHASGFWSSKSMFFKETPSKNLPKKKKSTKIINAHSPMRRLRDI